MRSTSNIRATLNQFRDLMQSEYGSRLNGVWLYGSYARGEETAGSDIDLLVVLNNTSIHAATEIRRITDDIFSGMPEAVSKLSYVPVARVRFETEPSTLFYFIRKEGVEV
ncbi:MAG: nucleotidyltransferase domain-containing protein [Cytophagaceae bacterium]|nr:nucleotidyltransferase domain-containing protein [Cytophagaceae bacterium]